MKQAKKNGKRTAQYLRCVQNFGADAAFVANVILTQHSKPAQKLRNLWNLLGAGYEVRTAAFSIDTLLVNGHQVSWSALDRIDDVLDVVNPRYARDSRIGELMREGERVFYFIHPATGKKIEGSIPALTVELNEIDRAQRPTISRDASL